MCVSRESREAPSRVFMTSRVHARARFVTVSLSLGTRVDCCLELFVGLEALHVRLHRNIPHNTERRVTSPATVMHPSALYTSSFLHIAGSH